MARRPPRRGSFTPGAKPTEPEKTETDLAEAKRVATQFERAKRNRQARARLEEEAQEALPETPPEPKTTGRGLPGAAAPSGPAPAPRPAGPSSDKDPNNPFAGFAPEADDLTGAVARSRSDSQQVFAILFGMVFMVGAAALVVGVGGIALLYTYSVTIGDGTLAGAGDKDDVEHVRDTANPTEVIIRKPAPGPRKAKDPVEEEPEPVMPTTGDGTILVPKDILFHSMEVKCPITGMRVRADFRNAKATAKGLPLNEECRVTFQGSLPATTTIRGGQTKTCTFEPTNCR